MLKRLLCSRFSLSKYCACSADSTAGPTAPPKRSLNCDVNPFSVTFKYHKPLVFISLYYLQDTKTLDATQVVATFKQPLQHRAKCRAQLKGDEGSTE